MSTGPNISAHDGVSRRLEFVAISKKQATELVLANHYLHRECPISWSWGIAVDGEILGVLTIGKPMWSVACGLVGETKQDLERPNARWRDVYELNRLWVDDCVTDHCIESRFIGSCLRELKKVNPNLILVSYADTARGHLGVVYQATGFIYTGLSSEFEDITLEGYGDHRSVPKERQGEKIGNRRAWADDPNAIRVERSRKHRYVWFADPTDATLLVWEPQPNPKKPASCELSEGAK
ncbi:MAG: hypothetical protein ACLPH5_00590 [Candidatus Sulfotelmatobacter sp.]|jgi:hypothetical protein